MFQPLIKKSTVSLTGHILHTCSDKTKSSSILVLSKVNIDFKGIKTFQPRLNLVLAEFLLSINSKLSKFIPSFDTLNKDFFFLGKMWISVRNDKPHLARNNFLNRFEIWERHCSQIQSCFLCFFNPIWCDNILGLDYETNTFFPLATTF